MTAIIRGGHNRYKVIETWHEPHGNFYRLLFTGKPLPSGNTVTCIYRHSQLKIYNTLECRDRQHQPYKRTLKARRRIA